MVFVLRSFLSLLVLGMGYIILLWHLLSLPYNYFVNPKLQGLSVRSQVEAMKIHIFSMMVTRNLAEKFDSLAAVLKVPCSHHTRTKTRKYSVYTAIHGYLVIIREA